MESLFSDVHQPLAARLRPRSLDDFVGQDHIVGPGRLLRRAIQADQLSSVIFAGPPGTGKTTLALIVADRTRSQFLSLNAVLAGIKDLRESIASAREFRERHNRRTILFVDEVHRWNKSQQDALLPWVENGTVILIGATTENPFFEVNRALLSRSRVFVLEPLTRGAMETVVDRALGDRQSGYGRYTVTIDSDAREHLVTAASGDARTLLNALELAVETGTEGNPPPEGALIHVTLTDAEESIQQRAILYDKDGDYHFDTISAFIKSLRGSDPDAALYWLARMVEAGESPRYIFRRLLVAASEDVGLADPGAIGVVSACADAFDRVGMPEGQYHLAQATLYLANAPKSNSTLAYFDAVQSVRAASAEVPRHLRDASRDGADLGHGDGYAYPHAYRDHWVAQQYLPAELRGTVFYSPGTLGWEGTRSAEIQRRRELQLAIDIEAEDDILVVRGSRERTFRLREERRAAQGEEKIRDAVLDLLRLKPHHRLFLAGSGITLLTFEGVRRLAGGAVLVRCDSERESAVISHLSKGIPEVERPVVLEGNALPDHPVDRIAARLPVYAVATKAESSLTDVFRTARSVAAPEATSPHLVLALPDPASGTRLSTILELSETNRRALEEAERVLFVDPGDRVESGAAEFGFTVQTAHTVSFSLERSFRRPDIDGWFQDGAPLASELPTGVASEIAAVAAGQIIDRPVPWTRSYALWALVST